MIHPIAFPDAAAALADTYGLNPEQIDQIIRRVANDRRGGGAAAS